MTITSDCEYLDPTTNAWRQGGTGTAGLKAKPHQHAERVAYAGAQARITSGTNVVQFRLTQNDFPCVECAKFFADESLKGLIFDLVATANGGGYAVECGYLPKGDSRQMDKNFTGTLRIVNGEARGLYTAKIFAIAKIIAAQKAAADADQAYLRGRKK